MPTVKITAIALIFGSFVCGAAIAGCKSEYQDANRV
jgi:hypothetical protein